MLFNVILPNAGIFSVLGEWCQLGRYMCVKINFSELLWTWADKNDRASPWPLTEFCKGHYGCDIRLLSRRSYRALIPYRFVGSLGESMVSETFRGLIERADYYARQEKFRKLDEHRNRLERIEHSVLVHS